MKLVFAIHTFHDISCKFGTVDSELDFCFLINHGFYKTLNIANNSRREIETKEKT